MPTLIIAFWLLLFIVFYSYIGYGILLGLLVKLRNSRIIMPDLIDSDLPNVTFLIAAYNEEAWIEAKIRNSLALNYPKDKIQFFFVTDGSNDKTMEHIINYKNSEKANIQLFHQDARRGKIAAVERVMPFVETPIIVFTDANTDINPQAIRNIVRHYKDFHVGAVAGEKRVQMSGEASGAGEGIYWKYESLLKNWDSRLYSAVGAAGELFSIRTDLYKPVETDTLIEDFVMTMRIAQEGYKIVYEPNAYAIETHSANVKEELKRKIRISAGGLQAVWRLRGLLNPFKYPVLSFQYISHRVLRWTLAPLALPLIFLFNAMILMSTTDSSNSTIPFSIYQSLFVMQIFFYIIAVVGWIFEQFKIKIKAFYVPFYFCMMNYSVYRGFIRLMLGQQSVVWEKSKRA